MSWAIGKHGSRDIGYGVPAICDHPKCSEEIDRGLAYICCGQELSGGEDGCGLFFCKTHRRHGARGRCIRCHKNRPPFTPKPDIPQWLAWKATDESWQEWRTENPAEVIAIKARLEQIMADEKK